MRPNEVLLPSQAHWWLFKPIKTASYRRYDDWSEKLAAELASLLALPAAQIELARGLTDSGIISLNVTPDGWSMESGDTMLSEFDGYESCANEDRPRNRIGHNLNNIAQVLAEATGPPDTQYEEWTAFEVFAGYLVFDAWIANTDRHAINWGVLSCEADGRLALAASFDHGSALASGAQDERLKSRSPWAYATSGSAARFEGGAKVTLVDLALDAVAQAGGRAREWRDRLASVSMTDVATIMGGIEEMSEVRRTFLCTLLEINQGRLTS